MQAISSIHSLGFIHRNLHPYKIRINTIPEFELKIDDFHKSTSINDEEPYKALSYNFHYP